MGRSPTNSGSRGRGYVSRPHRVHRRHRAKRHRRRRGIRAGAVPSPGSHHSGRASRHPGGPDHLPRAGRRPTSIARGPTTAPAIRSSPRRTSPDYLPNYAEYKAAVEATASLPDSDPHKTPPIEFGRMEPTASDPSVQQQFGMTVGIPNAGQVRALGMINIRGERSVTCKGEFDKHPSAGPLPAGAPAVCEEFRRQPDALERADGARPAVRPQSRPGGDADVLHPVLVQGSVRHQGHALDRRRRRALRHGFSGARSHAGRRSCASKGAIIYAKANTPSTTAAAPAIPAARISRPRSCRPTLGYQRSTWAGNPCNSYDTTRAASIGSSSGSGVSVSTNLVMCSLCEETGAIVPRPRQPQFGGADPAAQGACCRSSAAPSGPRSTTIAPAFICRSDRRRGARARRAQGPGQRLLRPARHLHHRAALEPAERAL